MKSPFSRASGRYDLILPLRKRHIGNDIVVIIFRDADCTGSSLLRALTIHATLKVEQIRSIRRRSSQASTTSSSWCKWKSRVRTAGPSTRSPWPRSRASVPSGPSSPQRAASARRPPSATSYSPNVGFFLLYHRTTLRDLFLACSVINAECAALAAPGFRGRLLGARRHYLEQLVVHFLENRPGSLWYASRTTPFPLVARDIF
jgi:hypothetical protein